MANLNSVQLIGNVGADPEARATSSGQRVATVSMATSEKWTDAKGQERQQVEWHRLIFWDTDRRKLASLAERSVHRGDALYIAGKIRYKKWDNKEGETQYSTEIHVEDVQFLTPKRGNDAGQAAGE